MIGYIFMAVVVVILLPLVYLLLQRGRGPRPAGKVDPTVTVERREPSADEPTADISVPRDRDGRSRIPPA